MPLFRKLVTSKEVAEAAGVSRSTVSLVFNEKAAGARISEPTRQRVQGIAEELGYVPNPSARALINRRNHTIGLMTTDSHISLNVPKFEDFAVAAIEHAAAQHYNVVVPSTIANRRSNGHDSLSSLQVDGVILQSRHFDFDLARQVIDSGLPFVAVEPAVAPQAANCVATVSSDHSIGSRTLATHLISSGHRVFGLVSGPVDPAMGWGERFDAVREEVGDAGTVITATAADWSAQSGRSVFDYLWSRNPRPDVIFAGNDYLAAGVMKAAITLGLRIPSDLAIAGFGDFRMSDYLTPALTTIRWPLAEMGVIAADVLIEYLKTGTRTPAPIVLPTECIRRDST